MAPTDGPYHTIIRLQLCVCVCVCVCLLWRVSGSQLTSSQKLVHHLTEQLRGYGSGTIQGAHNSTIPTGKSTRLLGVSPPE